MSKNSTLLLRIIISSVGALIIGVLLRGILSRLLFTFLPWASPGFCSYFDKTQPGAGTHVKIIPCDNFLQSLEFMMISLVGLIILSFVVIFHLLKKYFK